MKSVFFYGLFMDEDALKEKGFHPSPGKIAYAEGYGLRIGARATLIKSEPERAYGVVMELSHAELEDLYSIPSVVDYIPEQIQVTELSGSIHLVDCYNLPFSRLSGSNQEYAQSLSITAKKVGLPQTYVEEILSLAG